MVEHNPNTKYLDRNTEDPNELIVVLFSGDSTTPVAIIPYRLKQGRARFSVMLTLHESEEIVSWANDQDPNLVKFHVFDTRGMRVFWWAAR